jgi:hypothetical protein
MTEKSSPRGRPIKNKVDQSPASPEHGFADRTPPRCRAFPSRPGLILQRYLRGTVWRCAPPGTPARVLGGS